jgi:ATP phosphoribosyltransferase regulatory subunit
MVYQPPVGARDLLPIDVAQKSWIEERLQQVFHRWGYHRIITSTLERMDTLMAGGAIQGSTVVQLQTSDNEGLGLRPELTASIARTAVTRMQGTTYPQRLYYNANVFQNTRENRNNLQMEYYQAGVELLGGDGLISDGEVLLLLADCINSLDLPDWNLILGEAGITGSLLSAFPPKEQNKVRSAIANLDRVTLDSLPLSHSLRDRAHTIMDLRGNPADVLQKVSSLGLNHNQQLAVNNLKSLVELLNSATHYPIILDLSLLQTIDYYTGVIFQVTNTSNGKARVLGKGGRYDQLLGQYHAQGENIPGIGFALSIEDIYQALSYAQQLPKETPATNWLVVAQTPQAYAAAFAYGATLRDSTHLVRVEMELGARDNDGIRRYARDRRIGQIAWIQSDGSPIIESLN